jgi:hypothetical protein
MSDFPAEGSEYSQWNWAQDVASATHSTRAQTGHAREVRTSQETHHISATEPNRLMLCGETVAVCRENRTENTHTHTHPHTHTLCVC